MPDNRLASIFAQAARLVFPPACPLCRNSLQNGAQGFCPDCIMEMTRIEDHKCPVCGKPFFDLSAPHLCGDCIKKKPPFKRARSWGLYDKALADAVREFKFQRRHGLAGPLAGLLGEVFDREMPDAEFDLVVPVPLHKRRLRERGYDQATLIARHMAARKEIAVSVNNLQRTRFTLPQYGLSLRQRQENVRGAFALKNPGEIKDRHVLLVDDVYTTGSTAKECCRVIKRAGALAVEVLTVARAG